MESLGTGFWVVQSIIVIFGIIIWWKLFQKAGKPGWASIVPLYNIIVQLEIVGRPLWWLVMFFIPIVGIVFAVIVVIDFAKAFGKDTGFAVGMILLPFIFLPILAFGNAEYRGPVAAMPDTPYQN
jgi:hypothetical protein